MSEKAPNEILKLPELEKLMAEEEQARNDAELDFIKWEDKHGSIAFVKACLSVCNQVLVGSKLVTTDQLTTLLKEKLERVVRAQEEDEKLIDSQGP